MHERSQHYYQHFHVKNSAQLDFLAPIVFIKRITLVSIDMLSRDFEFRQFLWWYSYLKYREIDSPLLMTMGSQQFSLNNLYFYTFNFFLLSHAPYALLFFASMSLLRRGYSFKQIFHDLCCQQQLPTANDTRTSASPY
jgi:hypothetical protein